MQYCYQCINYQQGYCMAEIPEWAEKLLGINNNKNQVIYNNKAYNCLCFKKSNRFNEETPEEEQST